MADNNSCVLIVVLPKCPCKPGHTIPETESTPEYFELDAEGLDYFDRAKPAAARFMKLSQDPTVIPAVHLEGMHIVSVTVDGKMYK